MTKGEFDKEDVALAGVFVLAAASGVGIAEVTLFDVAFSDPVVSGLTLGTLLSGGIFGFAYLTNDNDLGSLDDGYTYTVYVTAALIVGIAMVPGVESFVTQNDLFRLLALVVQSLGYAAVSYMA
ncbi:hypothetical protein BRD00_01580 [Halobacteriales archaeon QS_8_69_26]|nr:MAG: hypothetical protein BRD00_01580 [Halobacteriales archaeon QS_8_69_26]